MASGGTEPRQEQVKRVQEEHGKIHLLPALSFFVFMGAAHVTVAGNRMRRQCRQALI